VFPTLVYAIPFVLLGVALIAILNAVTNFRRARRAPYFRIRRDSMQAAWRWCVIALIAALAVIGSIAARDRLLSGDLGTLPLPGISGGGNPTPTLGLPPIPTVTSPPAVSTKDIISAPPTITPTQPTPTITSTPPISTIASRVTASADAILTITAISSGISADLRPLNASLEFAAGIPRIYVWIEYSNLADGVSWSRVLLRNGALLISETELWERGTEGVAYYFFDSETGWGAGSYEVQFYIGATLASSKAFSIID
jgi:hypothetical protein